MQAVSHLQVPTVEYLELYRLYMAYRKKAEELCHRYGIESKVVIFTS